MALNQPVSLLNLSSQALGSYIANHAVRLVEKDHYLEIGNVDGKEELKLSIKKYAEDYDAIIPPSLHNLVTYHSLQYMKENKVQIPEENDLVIDIVLRSHVTKFDFSDWPLEMHSILYRNLSKLKHLKLLRVKHLENSNLSYVVEGVKVMKNLEKFEFDHGFSEDILKVLCDNSNLLSLTMKGGFIPDSSVGHLLKLRNLQELNIFGTRISDQNRKELLLGLPQLKTLIGVREFGMVPESDSITSLESVELMCLREKHVENLINFCPSVKNLKLFGLIDIHASKLLDLSSLTNLHNLTTLFIWAGCFYTSNIKVVLKKIGHQITDLGFYDIHNVSLATLLDEINTSCSNLKVLRIWTCVTDDVNPIGNQHVFQNLQSVDLSVSENMTSCSIYFLCSCVNIREVYFGRAMELCDNDIDRILSRNPLTHLQELCIANHKLTAKSIYKLLSSCGELRYIGFVDRQGILNYWATITDLEIEELRNYVQKNNLNVEFVSNYQDIEEKKRVSVMKPEWSELPQSALYMKGRNKSKF